MVSESNQTAKKWHQYVTVPKPWDELILLVISILLTVPTFLIVHRNLPDFKWRLYAQEVVTALLIICFYLYVLQRFRKVVLICLMLYFLVLIYGTLLGGYGFRRVTNDYTTLLYSLNDSPYPQDVLLDKVLPFPNKSDVLAAIDYQNPVVRDFAVMAAREYGQDIKGYESYYRIVQCFAVFKKINANWFYVSDPKNQEYFAAASESVRLLSGDCDDHAILMAAATRAIGGTPRLIHTNGHLYPE
jgi:Ca2+/Na+ antiporter